MVVVVRVTVRLVRVDCWKERILNFNESPNYSFCLNIIPMNLLLELLSAYLFEQRIGCRRPQDLLKKMNLINLFIYFLCLLYELLTIKIKGRGKISEYYIHSNVQPNAATCTRPRMFPAHSEADMAYLVL
jgi:hypothetical protein